MVLKRTPDSSMFASDPSKSGGLKPNLMLKQINLLRGWPSTQLLPANLLKQGAQSVLSQAYEAPTETGPASPSAKPSSRPIDYDSLSLAEKSMLYGPDGGHHPLRVALGKWFQSFYGPATSRAYPRAFQEMFAGHQNKGQNRAPTSEVEYQVTYDRIALTGGASQSLGVIMTALTDPTYTRKVWLVAPTYFLAFNIFRDAGFAGRDRMVAVPELALNPKKNGKSPGRGPDVSWLRRAMEQCEHDWKKNGGASEPQLKPYPDYKKIYKHIIYIVPSFSNPSSITSTLNVREDLVRCARDFDALVVCDDVYDMLQWPARTDTSANLSQENLDIAPLPRLVDIDRLLERENVLKMSETDKNYGNVVSNGTFSKICGPGCRVGWVEAAPDLAFTISQAGTTKSGGSPGHLVSTFLNEMLEQGTLQQHVREVLRPGYAERWAAMVRAIEEQLVPLGVKMPHPHGDSIEADGDSVVSKVPRAGGYFIWLALPDGLNAQEVAKRGIEEENLIVAGGNLFQVPGEDKKENDFKGYIRLCFSWEALPDLEEGVRRLAKVLRKMISENASGAGSQTSSRVTGRNSFSGYA